MLTNLLIARAMSNISGVGLDAFPLTTMGVRMVEAALRR